jgi:hypothetical protein
MQLFNHKTPLPFSSEVLIVVTVPETHADLVREAMGKAGAGTVGNYTFCSFSFKGVGRFLPGVGANPAIGSVGKFEAVAEETIQTPCSVELLDTVIAAIKAVHPYEKPSIDLMPLYEYPNK